jgi:hypothetical protein
MGCGNRTSNSPVTARTPEVFGLDLPAQDLAGHDRIQGGRADDSDALAAGEMTTG